MKSTITKAGQTTVPADIRRSLGWPPRTTVDWCVEGGHAVVVKMEPKERREEAIVVTPLSRSDLEAFYRRKNDDEPTAAQMRAALPKREPR